MSSESLREEHERLGLAVTKLISEHAGRLDSAPVTSAATPADLKLLFDEPLPVAGMPAEEILTQFKRDVAPHAMQVPSPRYFGQFNPTPLALRIDRVRSGSIWRVGERRVRSKPDRFEVRARFG